MAFFRETVRDWLQRLEDLIDAGGISAVDTTARASAAAAQSTANTAQSTATSASSAASSASSAASAASSAASAASSAASAAATTASAAVPKALYDANSILAATTDDTPAALTVGASTFVGRKASGDISAMSTTEAAALLTDLVPKSLYDANTVLAATSDNTPVALTVGASTFVGRKASGNIAAMSTTEAATLLTDLVPKSLYDANSILAATSDDTPAVLTIAASRIVGRKATGNIAALTAAEVLAILGTSGGTPNMFLDAPTSANTDDVECTADLATLGYTVYNHTDSQTCTRAGDVNPWAAQTSTTTYRSTYRNGRILFQGSTTASITKTYSIYKSLASAPNDDCFYTLTGRAGQAAAVTAPSTSEGQVFLSLWKTSGGLPDLNNRYLMGWSATRTSSTDVQLFKQTVLASVATNEPTTVDGKLWPLFAGGIVGLKYTAQTGALGFAIDPITGAFMSISSGADNLGGGLVAGLDKWGWLYQSGGTSVSLGPPYGTVCLGFLRRCATFPGMT